MLEARKVAIGLDVGGTKIAGGLVDLETGRPLTRRVIPTGAVRGGAAVLVDALELATRLMSEAEQLGRSVSGIGISVCELVDLQGHVTSQHVVAWQGLPVAAEFSRLAPAVVEADVRAHALAEAVWGAGRGLGQFVFITVGTGISSCLVLEGRPFAGAHGNALILASSPSTAIACPVCGHTQWPAVEDYAGGPALAARFSARVGRPVGGAEEVIAAADSGDPEARAVVRSGGRALGASLGGLVNILDPEVLIVGGGLGSAGGLYWASLVESTREHIWADASRGLPILRASLGPDAGLIGAALAAGRRDLARTSTT